MVKKLSREFIKRLGRRGGDEISNSGGGGISPGAIEAALAGYAKEGWVNENYLSIEFFNRIFTIHGTDNNTDVDVEPNDLDTTITSIEAMFGFWTDYYVSALGNGGDLGSTLYLSSLADVALTSPISDGQVLQYNLSTGKWTNATLNLGSLTLSGLSDVLLTTPSYGDVLLYDGTRWINSALKTINNQSVIGSGNISVGGGSSGNYLPLTGGTLTNASYGQQLIICRDDINGNPAIKFINTGNLVRYVGFDTSISTPADSMYITSSDTTSKYYIITDDWINRGFYATRQDSSNEYVGAMNANGGVALLAATRMGLQINATVNKWLICGVVGTTNTYLEYGDVIIGEYQITPAGRLHVDGYAYAKRYILGVANGTVYQTSIISTDNGQMIISAAKDNFFHIGFRGGDYIISMNPNNLYMGVGTTSPSYKLHVAGTIYATGSVTALSDARKKDVLGDAKIGVEQIADAPAVQFLWKGERVKDGLQVGSIAQYWQTVLPEVVMDKGGELSMQYGVAALVSAIITARKVVDHERRITELERENERLRTEIEQLRLN